MHTWLIGNPNKAISASAHACLSPYCGSLKLFLFPLFLLGLLSQRAALLLARTARPHPLGRSWLRHRRESYPRVLPTRRWPMPSVGRSSLPTGKTPASEA